MNNSRTGEYRTAMSDFDELVFQQRNKSYGAYFLRRRYHRNMSAGLLCAILIFLFCLIVPSLDWDEEESFYKMTEVRLENAPEIIIPRPKHAAANTTDLPKKTEKTSGRKATNLNPPKVINDQVKETTEVIDSSKVDTSQNATDTSSGSPDLSPGTGKSESPEDGVFDFVDVMPQFPGGQGALRRFISSKSVYPGSAFQNKIEGTVIIGFVIDKYGRVRDLKVLKSLYPACDEEALRVMRLSPDWIPAQNQGRNVSINFTIPIEFKLKR